MNIVKGLTNLGISTLFGVSSNSKKAVLLGATLRLWNAEIVASPPNFLKDLNPKRS
jgi:hypothetical protein